MTSEKNLRRLGDKGDPGISYPGDDGSEPSEVRREKAREYARAIESSAAARAADRAYDRHGGFMAWLFVVLFLSGIGLAALISAVNLLKKMGWF